MASYWIDTLVLKNWGEILTLLYCITLSSSRENQRSAQEVARRISGAVAGEAYAKSSQDLLSRQRAISGAVAEEVYEKVNIPSTHHKPLSPALHYLPFASRFPLPHFILAVLFALSFPLPFVCSCVSLLACHHD